MELTIRPSTKFIKIGYAAVIVLLVASIIAQSQITLPEGLPSWVIPGIVALLLLWPASRHWSQRFTKMTMVGDKLRYETGMLSKATLEGNPDDSALQGARCNGSAIARPADGRGRRPLD